MLSRAGPSWQLYLLLSSTSRRRVEALGARCAAPSTLASPLRPRRRPTLAALAHAVLICSSRRKTSSGRDPNAGSCRPRAAPPQATRTGPSLSLARRTRTPTTCHGRRASSSPLVRVRTPHRASVVTISKRQAASTARGQGAAPRARMLLRWASAAVRARTEWSATHADAVERAPPWPRNGRAASLFQNAWNIRTILGGRQLGHVVPRCHMHAAVPCPFSSCVLETASCTTR